VKSQEAEAVERIVNSEALKKSPRLIRFLRHLCEKHWTGQLDELSEQKIGVSVFERPADYSPAEDNIVRSHARLLRQKLERYFAEEGASEELLLTIPKGGYLPQFVERPARAEESVAAIFPEPTPPAKRAFPSFALALSAGLILGLCPFLISFGSATLQKHHPLWNRMFERDRSTLIVAADSGLVMFENLAKRTVGLTEYSRKRNPAASSATEAGVEAALAVDFGSRRYTSFADLSLVGRLVSLPEVIPERLHVAYARDLSINDFKRANAIFSGAVEANPWVELIASKLAFAIETDQVQGSFLIRNRTPAAGEPPVYAYNPRIDSQSAYGHIAFLPSNGDAGNMLLIEGTTTAGTEAASDFILNDAFVKPLLEQARLPSGELGQFEFLVEARNIGGSAPQAHLICARYDARARKR
jgi:hypothetical protein